MSHTLPSRTRVLANLVAHRQNGSFPMIGKYFSNGWKIWADFSNDWKSFSRVFQRLEKIFGRHHGGISSRWLIRWGRFASLRVWHPFFAAMQVEGAWRE
jgi:hypothetical protein